jgi:hypothetical protein
MEFWFQRLFGDSIRRFNEFSIQSGGAKIGFVDVTM